MRIIRNLKYIVLSLLVGTPVLATCDSDEIIIRMSHVNRPFNHPIGNAASMLEKRVNEEMDGKACMEVFGNSLLYTDESVIEALLSNDVQIAAPSFNKVEKYTTVYRLFALPFVFKNLAAVEDFQASLTGELLKNAMIGKGIRGLGFWHSGFLQLSGDKPMTKPEEVQGMSFGSSGSTVSVKQFEHLEGKPKSVSLSETFAALQSGELNGVETTWATFLDKDFAKVQEGITESNHALGGSIVIVSDKWMKSIPSDVSSVFLKIVQEVTQNQNKNAFVNAESIKQKIVDEGVNVRPLTQERRQEWAKALQPVWDEFSAQVHPRMIGYIQQVNDRN